MTCGNHPATGKATFDARFNFVLKNDQPGAPMRPFWLHLGADGGDQLRGTGCRN